MGSNSLSSLIHWINFTNNAGGKHYAFKPEFLIEDIPSTAPENYNSYNALDG